MLDPDNQTRKSRDFKRIYSSSLPLERSHQPLCAKFTRSDQLTDGRPGHAPVAAGLDCNLRRRRRLPAGSTNRCKPFAWTIGTSSPIPHRTAMASSQITTPGLRRCTRGIWRCDFGIKSKMRSVVGKLPPWSSSLTTHSSSREGNTRVSHHDDQPLCVMDLRSSWTAIFGHFNDSDGTRQGWHDHHLRNEAASLRSERRDLAFYFKHHSGVLTDACRRSWNKLFLAWSSRLILHGFGLVKSISTTNGVSSTVSDSLGPRDPTSPIPQPANYRRESCVTGGFTRVSSGRGQSVWTRIYTELQVAGVKTSTHNGFLGCTGPWRSEKNRRDVQSASR